MIFWQRKIFHGYSPPEIKSFNIKPIEDSHKQLPFGDFLMNRSSFSTKAKIFVFNF